jgi:uncharacterized membrane protein YphA (DoxX/SURF4 family)
MIARAALACGRTIPARNNKRVPPLKLFGGLALILGIYADWGAVPLALEMLLPRRPPCLEMNHSATRASSA